MHNFLKIDSWFRLDKKRQNIQNEGGNLGLWVQIFEYFNFSFVK